jgi:CxxC motif-containing protein (DUF1111 family)
MPATRHRLREPGRREPLQRARGVGVLAFTLVAFGLGACSEMLTTAPDPGDVFDAPLDGLTEAELAAFAEGDEQFGRAFAPNEGLGPIFNNVSCASCHSGDGRGRPENVLTRFSVGGDPALDLGGPQIQANADANDSNGDGISGRPNLVALPALHSAHAMAGGPGPAVGRFGRKAQVASLVEQTVVAYHQDMGITTEFRAEENRNPLASSATEAADRVADPELATTVVRSVVSYLRLLAPPAAGPQTHQSARGQAVFASIRCASCHVPSLRTAGSAIPALRSRTVELYSDLLLHDMGDGLADYRPDGQADGREWRTTPLWGLRIMRDFLNGQAFLLHDGRARSVEEAILLHGGEAAAARDSFETLSAGDRAALLDFVESR